MICYAIPLRNSYLMEALHVLMKKNAVKLVKNQKSLCFYQLFLVPNLINRWRPILDLTNLNKFLKTEKFEMETPVMVKKLNENV